MAILKIYGGKELNGEINISGAKNAALPIICACLLNNKPSNLHNIPNISDVNKLLSILTYLNVQYTYKNELSINPSKIEYKSLKINEVSKFRGSYYLVGVFLTLFNKCEIELPGGCNLGERPLDYHINAFKELGYEVNQKDNTLEIALLNINKNPYIKLPKPSVGATINTILASVKTGSTISNYAKEPEVIDTINYLKKIGYNIVVGKSIYIFPALANKKVNYQIIPDRIETMTYVIMALLCGKITIKNVNILHNDLIIRTLILNNANIIIKKSCLEVSKSKVIPFNFKTDYYPGIPTDIQPLLSVLFIHNNGTATIKDDIFSNRYNALIQLKKLGAKVELNPPYAKITKSILIGGKITATDLRAAAAIVLSALASNTITSIENIEIIERGYEMFFNNLKTLGAKFEVIYPSEN